MRKYLRQIHLWIGLTAGLVLVVIGLTGSSLVFYRFLEEQIYADSLLIVQQETEELSFSTLLDRVVADHPDKNVIGMMPPRHENATYIAYHFTEKEDGTNGFYYLSVNPYTGETMGEREFGKSVMTFIYKLHYTLTMGPAGAIAVGFIGIFFMVSMFSGLYLWWPKAGKWKQALWFKKGAKGHRRNFDIHRVFGFYPMVILVVVAFSGVYMIFPDQIKWGIKQFATVSPHMHELLHSDPQEGQKPISVEQAIVIAREIYPDAKMRNFSLMHEAEGIYEVSFDAPGQPMTSWGGNTVHIDPYTAEVMHVTRWADATPADVFLTWQFPLHNGEAFGLIGRWIILFSGFIPAVLYVTGILMWLKRRKKKDVKEAQPRRKLFQKTPDQNEEEEVRRAA